MFRKPTKVVWPPPTHLKLLGCNLVLSDDILRSSLDSRPGCERHDAMVNNMQHWQVGELLPQQEEQGVKVVNELWEEVPPGHVQCIHAIIGIWNRSHSSIRESCHYVSTWVVHRLTEPVVAASQPEAGRLEPDPETEQRLQQVIHNLDPGGVIGLPVLHEPWPSYSENRLILLQSPIQPLFFKRDAIACLMM